MKSWLGAIAISMAVSPALAENPPSSGASMQKYQDLKWQKINPEMGSKSAEIAVLHVNPTTQATEMLIRTPKDTMCQSIGIAPMRQLLLYMASSS